MPRIKKIFGGSSCGTGRRSASELSRKCRSEIVSKYAENK